MMRHLSRKAWPLIVAFAVLWFVIGMVWANRVNGDNTWWRYSNYRLRQQARTEANFLRASVISEERQLKHQPDLNPSEELKLFYAGQRVNLFEMTEILDSRLRPRDRAARVLRIPHLDRLYANPQTFEDLEKIADDLDWMAQQLPYNTPVVAWLEARLWLWD